LVADIGEIIGENPKTLRTLRAAQSNAENPACGKLLSSILETFDG
jgi:hypothetical protein